MTKFILHSSHFITHSNPTLYLIYMIYRYETEVVKEIIDIIMRRLNNQPLNVGKNVVGIDVHLKKLNLLMNTELNKVSVVGIY